MYTLHTTTKSNNIASNFTGIAEHTNGTKYWYFEGELHRLDGPAIEDSDGTKEWFVDGNRHRTDGPACEHSDGKKRWFVDGKRHRLDGPAIEYINGSKEWFVEGNQVIEQKHAKLVLELTKPSCEGKMVEIDGKKYKLVSI